MINFNKKFSTFTITTDSTSYQMKVSEYGHLLHTYYGKKLDFDMSYAIQFQDRAFSPCPNDIGKDRTYSCDFLPQEFPCEGNGDFRHTAIAVRNEEGISGLDLRYEKHNIVKGKYSLEKLPSVYTTEESESLEIILSDKSLDIEVKLLYSAIDSLDVITRSVIVTNKSTKQLVLQHCASMNLDLLFGDYRLTYFPGSHGNERYKETQEIKQSEIAVLSRRGTSSHQANPFVIISDMNTTEDSGSCYGIGLLYSGSFSTYAEKDQFGMTRLMMGVLEERFNYELAPGERFIAPETTLVYSNTGFTTMSHHYHDLVRYNIVRGEYKTKRRPILINNWEATYFDFNKTKLITIAEQAAKLGVEMLVLDDGWFANRFDDYRGLGDWIVNEEKLGSNLKSLAKEINNLGMKFGLWIEPEMVNEDSALYREHPDWALTIPLKRPNRGRSQLVLDFSRHEIVDYIFEMIADVIRNANIEYIKMDMNRSLTDVATVCNGYQSQGKVLYNYVLGVYYFIERLHQEFPNLLIEGCSGGGGRFDLGMLYYTPQIWCSDNTDAIDRIKIQHGTSFCYPICSVDSNISAVPNHQTGRITPFNTRFIVASSGNFGYQLDLAKLTEEEKAEVPKQIEQYKKLWDTIHNGYYYRLTDASSNNDIEAWMMVKKDKSEAVLNIVAVKAHYNWKYRYVVCKGLDENAMYQNSDGKVYQGAALMNLGLLIPNFTGDYQAFQFVLTKIS